MITPCIHFQGNCSEAISFYEKALAAEVNDISCAKDAPPDSGMDEFPPNYVMYSEVDICGITFMLSDGGETPIPYGNFSFMIAYDTAEEVKLTFEKLKAGGKVTEPLANTFWSELYGEVVDRFGVAWQVMVRHDKNFDEKGL